MFLIESEKDVDLKAMVGAHHIEMQEEKHNLVIPADETDMELTMFARQYNQELKEMDVKLPKRVKKVTKLGFAQQALDKKLEQEHTIVTQNSVLEIQAEQIKALKEENSRLLKMNREMDLDVLKTVLDCGNPSLQLTALIREFICRQQQGITTLIKLEKNFPALVEKGQRALMDICYSTLYPSEPTTWQQPAVIDTKLFDNKSSVLTKYFTESGFLKPINHVEITDNDFSRILSSSSDETLPGKDPMITGNDTHETEEDMLLASWPESNLLEEDFIDADQELLDTDFNAWDINLPVDQDLLDQDLLDIFEEVADLL